MQQLQLSTQCSLIMHTDTDDFSQHSKIWCQINAEKKLSQGKENDGEEGFIRKNSRKKGGPAVRRLSRPVGRHLFIVHTRSLILMFLHRIASTGHSSSETLDSTELVCDVL